ncbi:MAG: TonB-dependent receptor [Acidobacteriota bacterium]
MMKCVFSWCCLAAALILVTPAQAQKRHAVLSGTVIDAATRAPIEGSIILILDSPWGAITDRSGRFTLSFVPSDRIRVQASALGFAPAVLRTGRIAEGDTLELSIALQEKTIQVGEVLVSGIVPFDSSLSIQPVHVMDARLVRNTAGAFDDVVRTVSILPGMAQTKPEHNDLYVRGGSSTENLFFIDNVEVPNINHFGAQGSTGGTMSFVNFEFLENVTFSNGGFGVRYGDRLSSVLSLGLRSGRTDRMRGKASISATMAGLNLEGPVGGAGSFLFSARRSYLDPVFRFYGFGFIPYFWDFLGKATLALDASNSIDILSVAAIDRMTVNNATEQNRYDNERMIFSDQNLVVSGVTWKRKLARNGSFSLTARKSYADFNYNQMGKVFGHYLKNISYEDENSLRADLKTRLSDQGVLSSGIEGRLAKLDSRMVAKVIATGFAEYKYTIPVDTTQRSTAYKADAYVEYAHTLGRLTASAGLRADYFSMIANETVVAPRLRLSYEANERTTVTASAGRFYQSPSYIWLMTNPYNRGLNHLGMNQYTAGVTYQPSADWSVSVEVYEKRYFNYPVSLTRPYLVMVNSGEDVTDIAEAYTAFGLDFLQSLGTGRARGIDILVEKQLSGLPLFGRASLSIGQTRFRALDGNERPASSDQPVVFNAGGGWLPDEKWEFTGTFRYSSGRPYAPIARTSFYLRSCAEYNTARTDANHRLDLRAARKWETDSFRLSAYIDIQNVYNRPWRGVPFYSDRNKRMELPTSTGIVPSVGFTAEF